MVTGDTYGYERWVMFPLLGFMVYRLPYLYVGLVVLLASELIVLEVIRRTRKSADSSFTSSKSRTHD
jgi:hypothetical protein